MRKVSATACHGREVAPLAVEVAIALALAARRGRRRRRRRSRSSRPRTCSRKLCSTSKCIGVVAAGRGDEQVAGAVDHAALAIAHEGVDLVEAVVDELGVLGRLLDVAQRHAEAVALDVQDGLRRRALADVDVAVGVDEGKWPALAPDGVGGSRSARSAIASSVNSGWSESSCATAIERLANASANDWRSMSTRLGSPDVPHDPPPSFCSAACQAYPRAAARANAAAIAGGRTPRRWQTQHHGVPRRQRGRRGRCPAARRPAREHRRPGARRRGHPGGDAVRHLRPGARRRARDARRGRGLARRHPRHRRARRARGWARPAARQPRAADAQRAERRPAARRAGPTSCGWTPTAGSPATTSPWASRGSCAGTSRAPRDRSSRRAAVRRAAPWPRRCRARWGWAAPPSAAPAARRWRSTRASAGCGGARCSTTSAAGMRTSRSTRTPSSRRASGPPAGASSACRRWPPAMRRASA